MPEPCDITIILAPQWHIREPWTAPAYICETLRAKGWRVQFLDYNIRAYHWAKKLGYEALWQEFSFHEAWREGEMAYLSYLFDLEEIQGGVIGFSTTQQNVPCSVELAKRIRARYPNRKIIFGGHEVFFPEQVKRVPTSVADAICQGEGEHTICEVMERSFEGLEAVSGLYLPSEEGWCSTGHRCPEPNLDNIPWPRFSEIDHRLYGRRFIPLMGSRGCSGRCIFCGDRYATPGYRVRSAMNQVDELEYLSQAFDVEHFPYNDPHLDGNLHVLEEKTNEIIRRGLNVRYGGNMMVSKKMPEDLFPKLKKSGMTVALIGVESGSKAVLRDMRKRHTPELAAWFLRNLHDAGIRTEVNFLLGFPSETEEHFQESMDFIRQNHSHIDCVISIAGLILLHSDLLDQRERFNIVVNEQTGIRGWYLPDGSNTLEIREERVARFIALCREYGLIEDYLMGDHHTQDHTAIPSAAKFLREYEAYWRQRADCTEEERKKALNDARPLAAAVRQGTVGNSLTPAVVLRKLVSNLKKRGIRQTLVRAKEWYQIHRG